MKINADPIKSLPRSKNIETKTFVISLPGVALSKIPLKFETDRGREKMEEEFKGEERVRDFKLNNITEASRRKGKSWRRKRLNNWTLIVLSATR